MIVRLARSVLLIYLCVLLLMLFLENILIFPAPKYPAGDWNPSGLGYEDVYFESADGTRLHGWYLEHPDPRTYILFCHGNGEHVAYLAPLLRDYFDEYHATVLAFDYRGYGRSEGKPNEKGVLADGHAAHAWLLERAGIKPNEMMLIGRSLGAAITVDLAAAHGARGLVLERTFTSIADVAARHYPFLPIRAVMKTQFDSQSKITQYDGPLLQCHGTEDHIVPFDLGRKLFETATTSEKVFVEDTGYGHNDPYSREYTKALKEFLFRL